MDIVRPVPSFHFPPELPLSARGAHRGPTIHFVAGIDASTCHGHAWEAKRGFACAVVFGSTVVYETCANYHSKVFFHGYDSHMTLLLIGVKYETFYLSLFSCICCYRTLILLSSCVCSSMLLCTST